MSLFDTPHAFASMGAVACTVLAHLSLRTGARAARRPVRLLFTLAAMGLFGLTTLLGLYGLARMPLKTTTVWSAASYPAVSLAAIVLFRERPSRKAWLGIALVVAGIVLFGYA